MGALRSVRSASPTQAGSPSSARSVWSPPSAATGPEFFATVNPLSPVVQAAAATGATKRSSTNVSDAFSFHSVVTTAAQKKGHEIGRAHV